MRKTPSALGGLYLEDSYFTGLLVSGTALRIRALFALTQDHEDYAAPISGEQHCYREGEIVLTEVKITEWAAGKPTLLSDPDGSMDLGSLSIGEREGHYQISTEWFDMACRAGSLRVMLD